MATMRERIAERYPALVSLLREPEIGRLLTQAVQQNWSPGVFQSKFMASRWFRTQSEAQRRWWVTAHTDPGEAKQQRNAYSAEVITAANQLGIGLRSNEVKYFTEIGLQRGLGADSARMMADMLAYSKRAGILGAGAYKTAQRAVRNLGSSQWMREPPRAETEKWAADIALGRKTLDDFNAASAYTASKRFPYMAKEIAAGRTVAEIAAPGVEAYAREMDWDPNGLMAKMYTNPQFGGLLGIRDPKSGEMRMPTEYEAQTMARKRADWWGTTGGRQADAQMTTALLEMFGKRA